jgi:hypothetical protein
MIRTPVPDVAGRGRICFLSFPVNALHLMLLKEQRTAFRGPGI